MATVVEEELTAGSGGDGKEVKVEEAKVVGVEKGENNGGEVEKSEAKRDREELGEVEEDEVEMKKLKASSSPNESEGEGGGGGGEGEGEGEGEGDGKGEGEGGGEGEGEGGGGGGGVNGTPKMVRPTRERKAVERYSSVSPASRSSGGKSLEIAKGNGTQLKDIPNVAYKLSKKKPDDNLQLLHMILFGRRAKVHTLKKDIGLFSGFVWADNEEKQRAKTKEKLDKCVKEKLLDFCDVLNIPINNRSSVKKEDLTVRLLEFLESPQATTDVLLADKDQKGKKPKKKATPGKSRSLKTSSVEKAAKKSSQAGEKRKRTSKTGEDVDVDDKDDIMDCQSHSSEGEDSMQKQESDQETDSEEEEAKEKTTVSKNSTKKNSEAKNGKKSSITKTSSSERPAKSPARSAKKTSGTPKKSTAAVEASNSSSKGKTSLSKKNVAEETQKEKPAEKPPSKKQRSKSADKSAIKDQGKGKTKKKTKSEPTNEELRAQAEITLKEVDFNTATLSDILRLLGSHFGLDLMHRKGEIKAIITEVIENMSDDGDDDDDDDEDKEDSGEE